MWGSRQRTFHRQNRGELTGVILGIPVSWVVAEVPISGAGELRKALVT